MVLVRSPETDLPDVIKCMSFIRVRLLLLDLLIMQDVALR